MRSGALSFLAGIMLLQQFAELQSYYWCVPVFPFLVLLLLPSKHVLKRYTERQIPVLSTALEGAIFFKLMKNQPITIIRQRRKAQRYWHYQRD